MIASRRPPRLVVKTLGVTFVTVSILLVIVFVVVSVSVSEQVRQSVTSNLESSQRMFAALETRRQRELVAQASAVAENPTLKAALDTYQTEARTSRTAVKTQLMATIDGELRKVAASIETDAVVLVDMHQNTLAAAGRTGERFPRGRLVALTSAKEGTFDGIAHMGGARFAWPPCRCSTATARRSARCIWRRFWTRRTRKNWRGSRARRPRFSATA